MHLGTPNLGSGDVGCLLYLTCPVLLNQIKETKTKAEGKFSRADPRKVAADRLAEDDDGLTMKAEFLDAKTSKRIMLQAQEQREEEERVAAAGGAAGAGKVGGAAGAEAGGSSLAAAFSGGLKKTGLGHKLLAGGTAESESEEEGDAAGGSDEDYEEYDDEVEVQT